MIPQTYQEWRSCIEHDCKIQLTKAFAAERLAVYQDQNNPETKKFASLYGTQHLQNVIAWYKLV